MITIFHNPKCHIWKKALDEVENALLDLNLELNYHVSIVVSQEQAQNEKFLGSPTVKIDGKDIDPMAEKLTNYSLESCRAYYYKNEFYEYPPKEMIKEALINTETNPQKNS